MDNSTIEIKNKNDLIVSSFKLLKNGVIAIGDPTYEEWENAVSFINHSQNAVHFWVGDIFSIGENMWGEKYSNAMDVTGFDYGTIANDCYVSRSIPIENRRAELSFEHHKEIAKLEPEEQKKWLERAVNKNLTVRDLRRELSTKPKSEFDKKQSMIDLEISLQRFCDTNEISREDVCLLIVELNGEKVFENAKLVPIDADKKTKLQFLFGK